MEDTTPEQHAGPEDLVLIQRLLQLTPEQRLMGLIKAAEFFAAAKRV